MLDAVTAPFFALGLALTLAAAVRFDFGALFLFGWLAHCSPPASSSVDAPSAVRAMDAPAAYLLAAIGVVALWERLAARDAPGWLRRAASAFIVAAGLALAVGINLWLYFIRLPGDRRVPGKFQHVGETRAGLAVAAAHELTSSVVAYVPRVFLTGGSYEVLRFTAGDATLRELLPTSAAPAGLARAAPPGHPQRRTRLRRATRHRPPLCRRRRVARTRRRQPAGGRCAGLRSLRQDSQESARWMEALAVETTTGGCGHKTRLRGLGAGLHGGT
ncbi:MAG: hypothetical protein U0232_02130 [Thermomicrobiales bacterium]